MSIANKLPVNFTVLQAAWREIERIGQLHRAETGTEPDVLSIAWGDAVADDGKAASGIVVGFYTPDERNQIAHGIEVIDGREVVFFITEKNYGRFQGKMLGYSAERGLHLA